MAFVSTCDVFYWSDYSRDPVISPVIVPGSGTGDGSTSSAGATISTPSSGAGNNAEGAEGRRLLQTTCDLCIMMSRLTAHALDCPRFCGGLTLGPVEMRSTGSLLGGVRNVHGCFECRGWSSVWRRQQRRQEVR